jgi:hypothetical protein
MRFILRLTLLALLASAVLVAGLSPGSPVLAQWIDDPWEIFTLHCETMQNRLAHEIGNDEDLRLSYHNLKLNYETVDEVRTKVPEAQRSRQDYRDCVAKLPAVKKLLAKAEELQRKKAEAEEAEARAANEADPYFKKAKDLGFDDYAGLVGIYASIRNGNVKRERLANYLIVADDHCGRRFKATGQAGEYYILSVDDTDYCGFGLVQVALKRSAGVSYREGEWIKDAYFRIVGTEEFQKSSGFPITLVVLEPVK